MAAKPPDSPTANRQTRVSARTVKNQQSFAAEVLKIGSGGRQAVLNFTQSRDRLRCKKFELPDFKQSRDRSVVVNLHFRISHNPARNQEVKIFHVPRPARKLRLR
jgi:hypothetical protein